MVSVQRWARRVRKSGSVVVAAVVRCSSIPVQGGGDEGRGVGGHGGALNHPGRVDGVRVRCEGGGEVGPGWWEWFAGQCGAGEGVLGEGESAAGFADGDPKPEAEELCGVPAPVIGR